MGDICDCPVLHHLAEFQVYLNHLSLKPQKLLRVLTIMLPRRILPKYVFRKKLYGYAYMVDCWAC